MKKARLCCTSFSNLVNEQCRTYFAQIGRNLYATAKDHIAEIKAEIRHVHNIILTGRVDDEWGDVEEQARMLNRVFCKAVSYVTSCSKGAQAHMKWLSFDISLLRLFNLCKCFSTFMFSEFEFLSPLMGNDENGEQHPENVCRHIHNVMDHIHRFVFEDNGPYVNTNMMTKPPRSVIPQTEWSIFENAIRANYSHVVISFLESELFSPPDQRAVLGACPTSFEEQLMKNLSEWKKMNTTLISVDINNIALTLLTSACDLLDGSDLSAVRTYSMERIKNPSFVYGTDQCIFNIIQDSKMYDATHQAEPAEANVE